MNVLVETDYDRSESNEKEEKTSRYRRVRDATEKADSPGTAADRRAGAASTRPIVRAANASWNWGDASGSGDIIFDYIEKPSSKEPPKVIQGSQAGRRCQPARLMWGQPP